MGATRSWKNWHRSRHNLFGFPKQASADASSVLEAQCGAWSAASCHGAMLLVSTLLLSSSLVVLHSCRSLEESSGWTALALLTGLGRTSPATDVEMSSTARDGQDVQWLISQAERNGTNGCDDGTSNRILLFGLPLPQSGKAVQLVSGTLYELLLISFLENGTRRCGGGDFFESGLTGARWTSRPPIADHQDGSYLLRLQLPKTVTGILSLRVVLLFGNLHGLDLVPDSWVQQKELLRVDIEFVSSSSSEQRWQGSHRSSAAIDFVPTAGEGAAAFYREKFSKNNEQHEPLKECSSEDFQLREWSGQWTRTSFNASCHGPDPDGRFRCLPPTTSCNPSWCNGPVGRIESNGWVYSAHCKFRIFEQHEAWNCVGSKWIFFWGDSNHQDTIRNLLNFVLGLEVGTPSRTFDAHFLNPENSNQSLRVTSIFGGHYQESENNLGLGSLFHEPYRKTLQSYFTGSTVPDCIVFNSGLHDGKKWSTLQEYVNAADFAARFWEGMWNAVRPDAKPKVVFRTTVAPAGESRGMPANPQKMEIFNRILVDRLLSTSLPVRVVDAYDMTFPWHFDNNCSDGGHYGRPPALQFWYGQVGHQYFVDVMLGHVLLNAICPAGIR